MVGIGIRRQTLPYIVIAVIIAVGVYGVSQVPGSGIVTADALMVSQNFDISEKDAAEVIEQLRVDWQVETSKVLESRLEKLVEDGKMDDEVKDEMLEVRDEILADGEAMRLDKV